MMMWRIIANAGYKSHEMTYEDAKRHAKLLKKLGNYDVKVVHERGTDEQNSSWPYLSYR